MKEFFEGLPHELDDAARVDGCSRLQTFIRIALPLARPGLGVTATICFMFSWNEYMYAAILSNDRTATLPLLFGLYYRQYEVSWGNIAAMGVLTALPVVVFGVLMQKNLARGLTLGAVKS
jgi:multiple sugar transport system permease protein